MEFVLEVSPEPEARSNYGGVCEHSVPNHHVAPGGLCNERPLIRGAAWA